LAADTPTIIARTLNPPIKTRFITSPPFRQENATLFIGSITGNKVKEARACGTQISGHPGGKIRINANAVRDLRRKSVAVDRACIKRKQTASRWGLPANGNRPALRHFPLVAE